MTVFQKDGVVALAECSSPSQSAFLCGMKSTQGYFAEGQLFQGVSMSSRAWEMGLSLEQAAAALGQ